MATVGALKQALTETLDNKGVLNELKARIRAEVFHAIEDPTTVKPQLSNENLLINELIREYLIFNNYKYTDSVLLAETGQSGVQLERSFLCQELKVQDSDESAKLPLLYSLLNNFVERKNCS
ncbi:centrosomal protein 20-like [Clavelina lepadiformis]|uniref:FGFR1 oncogene partner (FOP) N-terminal dimerisation domain-containing protein n=1 Tax=Clavelina lepadiformis TaxID=159417 RepID=A0ABP0H3F8_CLALP